MYSLLCVAVKIPALARVQADSDLPYEEEILRHPYQVKCWMRYVEHKQNTRAPTAAVNMVYERALKELPGRWAELDVLTTPNQLFTGVILYM